MSLCTLKLINCDYSYIHTKSNNDSTGNGNVVFVEQGIPFSGIQKKPRYMSTPLTNAEPGKCMSTNY
jgi:hypothetical protein